MEGKRPQRDLAVNLANMSKKEIEEMDRANLLCIRDALQEEVEELQRLKAKLEKLEEEVGGEDEDAPQVATWMIPEGVRVWWDHKPVDPYAAFRELKDLKERHQALKGLLTRWLVRTKAVVARGRQIVDGGSYARLTKATEKALEAEVQRERGD